MIPRFTKLTRNSLINESQTFKNFIWSSVALQYIVKIFVQCLVSSAYIAPLLKAFFAYGAVGINNF